MKKNLYIYLLVISVGMYAQDKNNKNFNLDRRLPFNNDWLFSKEDNLEAGQINYNDLSWRKLDLPHDWSIEDLPNPINDSIVGPFSKAAIANRDSGFLIGGTAWYRKHFILDKSTQDKKVFIQFDGVYMNSDVWINGKHLGNHPYGYTSFYYDITPYLLPAGKSNVIAVQVKNEGINSRWYSGSGIYRHVWLTIVDALHIDIWGTYITTPSVSEKEAAISIETKVSHNKENKPFTLLTELYDGSGKMVGSNKQNITTFKDNSEKITQNIKIENPKLWNLDNPALYKAVVKLVKEDKVVDQTTTTFGIRDIHFDSKSGFTLNGKNILLKGGNIHHDNGPLGAVAIDRAEERKVELLKQNGYNAIRFSHNPPSPAILDACDRLGMLVIDEAFDAWGDPKRPQDYHLYFNEWWQKDIEAMVLRDRNHPSIIMWSIGNEIYESIDTDGYQKSKMLADAVRSLDATRAVTMAIPKFIMAMSGRKGKKWDDTAPSFNNVDVSGYNYATSKYEKDHSLYPDRVMYESESFPPQAYESWEVVKKFPYAIGMFSWSAMDYIGEAGLGAPRLIPESKETGSSLFLEPAWPIFNAFCGELDLIGNKKVNSYYLDVVWERSKVEMLVQPTIPNGYKEVDFFYNFPKQIKSWSFPGDEGKKMKVFVHTRAELVKLELNGKIISVQPILPNTITIEFMVPYSPGVLVARCFVGGKEIASQTLKTVGVPYAVRLKADRSSIKADPNDLSYVNVEIVDKEGNVVPYKDDLLVKYQIEGVGKIAGVGNGNPEDISSFQQPQKKVFQGRGLVIVKPSGTKGIATITATVDGLKSTELIIHMN